MLEETGTEFVDTLIEAYKSLSQEEKVRVNEMAMKIYLQSDHGKELLEKQEQAVGTIQPQQIQQNVETPLSEPKEVATRLASSLKSLSKIGGN